jgi:Ran GTPase-activating protein (RanGAP) involved in mRNA processing and transport
LSENELGSQGAEVIAEMLLNNSTITWLDLSDSELCEAGAAAIGRALRSNVSVVELALSGNALGNGGGERIAEGLAENRTLKVLRSVLHGLLHLAEVLCIAAPRAHCGCL